MELRPAWEDHGDNMGMSWGCHDVDIT
jgi:hypothetical protein